MSVSKKKIYRNDLQNCFYFANGQNILKYAKNKMNIDTEKIISFSCCSLKDLRYSSVTFTNLAISTNLCFDKARRK